jgi:hypothetical protein
VSIGLATDFRELKHHFTGGKPLILYVCGQVFNLCLTLLMALGFIGSAVSAVDRPFGAF